MTATIPRVGADTPASIETLADRYDGLIGTCSGNYDKRTGLDQMDHFRKLVERTARYSGPGDEWVGEIIDELMTMTREHVIRRVHESGMAR